MSALEKGMTMAREAANDGEEQCVGGLGIRGECSKGIPPKPIPPRPWRGRLMIYLET